jgi:hypothetical protein
MLRTVDTPHAQAYIDGKISEIQFLKKIRYSKTWGFSWESYRFFFDLARDLRVPILGLSPKALTRAPEKRDAWGAKVLEENLRKHPAAKFLVWIGDLHLGKNHLPSLLAEKLPPPERQQITVIHQNPERTYREIATTRPSDDVDVVRYDRNTFGLLHTPPWIKLYSYLSWLEEKETPSDSHLREGLEDEFKEIIDFAATVFGISLAVQDRFQFLTKNIGKWEKDFDFFLLPRGHWLYTATPSLENLSALAVLYVHTEVSQRQWLYTSPRRQFYSQLWIHAFSFLGIKLVHPKRKHTHPLVWENWQQSKSPSHRRAASHGLKRKIADYPNRGSFSLRT